MFDLLRMIVDYLKILKGIDSQVGLFTKSSPMDGGM